MSRINLTTGVVTIAPGGVAADPAATAIPNDGVKFKNDGRVLLRISNADGADVDSVTVETTGNVDGFAVEDLTLPVGSSSTIWAGPFPPSLFNIPSGADKGYAYVDCAGGDTGVTVEAYRLP